MFHNQRKLSSPKFWHALRVNDLFCMISFIILFSWIIFWKVCNFPMTFMFVHWLDGWLVGWFVGHSVNVHFCAPIGALVTEWTTRNHVVRISSSDNFTINVHEKISVAWKGQACVTWSTDGPRRTEWGSARSAILSTCKGTD